MKDFSKNEWGLVLDGGGGKGAYQIGAYRALIEKGIDKYISSFSGSSIGALNAVFINALSEEECEKLWKSLNPDKFIMPELEMIDFEEGFVSRDGVYELFDQYVDFEKISDCGKTLYACTTEYDENGNGEGIARYHRLNYKSEEEIKTLLIASTALPTIYEPVRINGVLHRDGGMRDNTPIAPLYAEGIRHFIVISLNENVEIDRDRFEDAEFVHIKPSVSLGGLLSGTLDFSPEGAKKRLEYGYNDCLRALDFSDVDMSVKENADRFNMSAEHDYKRVSAEQLVDEDMDKINSLFNKFL